MGGRSGGSFGASARPRFEGGRGGTPRRHHRERFAPAFPGMPRALGADAYRPAVIESQGFHVNGIIKAIGEATKRSIMGMPTR